MMHEIGGYLEACALVMNCLNIVTLIFLHGTKSGFGKRLVSVSLGQQRGKMQTGPAK